GDGRMVYRQTLGLLRKAPLERPGEALRQAASSGENQSRAVGGYLRFKALDQAGHEAKLLSVAGQGLNGDMHRGLVGNLSSHAWAVAACQELRDHWHGSTCRRKADAL